MIQPKKQPMQDDSSTLDLEALLMSLQAHEARVIGPLLDTLAAENEALNAALSALFDDENV